MRLRATGESARTRGWRSPGRGNGSQSATALPDTTGSGPRLRVHRQSGWRAPGHPARLGVPRSGSHGLGRRRPQRVSAAEFAEPVPGAVRQVSGLVWSGSAGHEIRIANEGAYRPVSVRLIRLSSTSFTMLATTSARSATTDSIPSIRAAWVNAQQACRTNRSSGPSNSQDGSIATSRPAWRSPLGLDALKSRTGSSRRTFKVARSIAGRRDAARTSASGTRPRRSATRWTRGRYGRAFGLWLALPCKGLRSPPLARVARRRLVVPGRPSAVVGLSPGLYIRGRPGRALRATPGCLAATFGVVENDERATVAAQDGPECFHTPRVPIDSQRLTHGGDEVVQAISRGHVDHSDDAGPTAS